MSSRLANTATVPAPMFTPMQETIAVQPLILEHVSENHR